MYKALVRKRLIDKYHISSYERMLCDVGNLKIRFVYQCRNLMLYGCM